MKKILYRGILSAALLVALAAHKANAWIIFNSSFGTPASQQALNDALLKYQHQAKLVKGFANASAYSSHTATQRGFQGYDKFAITLGTMAGAQVPATTSNLSYYKHLADKLNKQGDVYVGLAWNAWALNVGVKLPADLYLSGKFGKLKYSYQEYDFDGTNTGFMINYQVIKPVSPPVKIILWRGISIGTGFLWQYNKTAYNYKAGSITSGPFLIKPNMKIFSRSESYVIPVEVSTALRLFWFLNLHAGGGIDFALGSSRLNYSGTGLVINTAGPSIGLYTLYGRQGGTGPTNFLPKIFCGPGLSLGPVIIDIPFTYYFNDGFNVGVTVGVVW
ncbi:MAG: hypothetical protein A2W19_15210 [Spirochaetes bacterium RBG_16_49_21]|nr:MAG: hypothetical protein A2W19_15210 [Spirochaetes bacterium RBG_16_49_21]